MSIELTKLDGIIFDMDGVIFDTERIGLKSWQIVADKHNIQNITETAKKCIGRNTTDSFEIIRSDYGDSVDIPKLYKESKIAFAELIEKDGLPLKKGAKELLQFLKDRNVKVGLASSTNYDTVTKQLAQAGLIDYFQIIVGGDMVTHSKPEPEIYLIACRKLGVNPESSIAVEDSYNGIKSAYKAKMMPVLVPDLIEPNDEMLEMSYRKY
ncbi:MAG: HAD family hydrolase, partial [Oscillospiraceae bacterium]